MNKIKSIILHSLGFLFFCGLVNAQKVSLDIVESNNGCGLVTDCTIDFICFDILMTVDMDKSLDSYNIWIQYDNSVLSRINGGDDSSCVIANGGDTNIETAAGAYRVAGIPGSPFPITANNQATVHTICFSIMNSEAINGTTLSVGGSLFGGALPTSITFSDGSTDAVAKETPLVLSDETISCLILPVELLSFDVIKLEPKKLLLEWVTLTEVNNKRFEIQRSFDGINFNYVNFVKGKGNSNSEQSYTFVDNIGENNRSSEVYYRLKQVDYDGGFEYSDIKMAELSQESRLRLFPNPVLIGEKLNIEGEYSEARLIDINGIQIMAFNQREFISTNELPKGIYYILFDNNRSEKFIVIQ